MDRSPKGNVAVTIRAGMRGPNGRMVYGLDGTVTKAYPPEDLSGGIPPPPAGSFPAAYMDCGNSPDVDRMIEACTQVILAPNASANQRGFAFTNRGIGFGRKGLWDRDIADETEAINLAPNCDYGYTARRRAYGAKGDLDRALADYDEAVRLSPTLALNHGNRATIYLDKGDIDRAIADADTAIRLDPDAIGPRHTRGVANLAKGDFASAITDSIYNAALRINDDDLASYGGRARAYLMLRDDPHAFADYDAAIHARRADPRGCSPRGAASFTRAT
jgi:tetratricopeptide (TPR) repeat protein